MEPATADAHTSVWRYRIPLVALTAMYAIARWFGAINGVRGADSAELLWSTEFRLILASWILADRRARAFSAPYDFEAFVFFAWPVVIPYYLYRTRGGRGVLYAFAVYFLYAAPVVAANVAAVLDRTR